MIVIDNFIKDKKYLKELNDKKHLFFGDTYDSKNYHHDVNWWKGWWKEKAKNINEEFGFDVIKMHFYGIWKNNEINNPEFMIWEKDHASSYSSHPTTLNTFFSIDN